MNQITISRKASFLDSKLIPDCKFVVGGDGTDIEEICGHRAIFANASPVFKNMFFGGIPEEREIRIPDIHPEIFHTMVEFFYTGTITISSVEQALEVWYAADKYNIEDLQKCIPDYIIPNITPQNVCCILRFSNLYNNEMAIKKCQEIIKAQISTVLNESSFLEADIATLSFILDQDHLKVREIDLFRALVRHESARKDNSGDEKSEQPPSISPGTPRSVDLAVKEASVSDENAINSCGEVSSHEKGTATQGGIKKTANNPVKELVKKIRFLTMTPEELAECVAVSSLNPTFEALRILFNISATTFRIHQIPEGYSTSKKKRALYDGKYWINHAIEQSGVQSYCGSMLQSDLHFKCNAKIKLTGVTLNNLYLFSMGCTQHFTFHLEIRNENNRSILYKGVGLNQSQEIPIVLYDPVFIDRGKYFTIKVTCDSQGQVFQYETYNCYSTAVTVDDVTFHFGKNSSPCECMGFIKSISFTICE